MSWNVDTSVSVSCSLKFANASCCESGMFNAILSMVMLIVPCVSSGPKTLISDTDAPIGVVKLATFVLFWLIAKLFMICEMFTLNPNGSFIVAVTESVEAIGAQGAFSWKDRLKKPMSIAWIGLMGVAGTKGTGSERACKPAESQLISSPFDWVLDTPVAVTIDMSLLI